MDIGKATALRLLHYCEERNLSVNELASISLVTQSSLENIILGNSHNPKSLTIVRVCKGLNITMSEFYDDEVFDDIDCKV